MSGRGAGLEALARTQIAELTGHVTRARTADLLRPCPGREWLGDGTVATVAAHAAGTFARLAAFVDGRRMPAHGGAHAAAAVDRAELLARLDAAGSALGRIAVLGDDELERVPAAGSLRFADGERTLEQVLHAVLKHQRHHLDAIAAALLTTADA